MLRWSYLEYRAMALALVTGCGGNPVPGDEPGDERAGESAPAAEEAPKRVTPPFEVEGELDGLLLVWFDADGVHGARKRSDIPEDRRAEVRVDSLRIPPDKRLDPDHVYVADVRSAGADGSYPVRVRTREWFEARIGALRPKEEAAPPAAALADTGVILYRTAWCGVCRSAASYMRDKGVAFVEKDVEKDPAASAEMQEKARRIGRTPRGVPVIDFHGNLMFGFDRDALDQLVRKHEAI